VRSPSPVCAFVRRGPVRLPRVDSRCQRWFLVSSQPVQPGDQLTVNIACPVGGDTCMQDLQDIGQNWQQSFDLPVPDGFSGAVAAVAAEKYNGGVYPAAVMVSGATVDGAPLGQYGPEPNQQPPAAAAASGLPGVWHGRDLGAIWSCAVAENFPLREALQAHPLLQAGKHPSYRNPIWRDLQ
jgi:hypothetical protein